MNQLTRLLEKELQSYLTLKPNSALDVINSKSNTLNYIKSKGSEEILKALLTTLIFDLNDFFKIEQMSDKQISQTVELIVGDINLMYLKPDDFILCFNRAKKGSYGELYNRLDGQIIFQWINLYNQERDNEIIELRIKESQQGKEDCKPKNMLALAGLLPFNKEIGQKVSSQNLSTEIKPPTLQEELTQEFNDLYSEQDGQEVGMRFVNYKGDMLDWEHYIATRINEKI